MAVMTEVQIRDYLSNALTYPDLFAKAAELRQMGVKETTLNRCVKDRRTTLLKGFKKVPLFVTRPVKNQLIVRDQPFVSCNMVPQNIYGSIVEVTQDSIILR